MRRAKIFRCVKCGKPFVKMVGGFVLTPEEKKLMLCPICDACKKKCPPIFYV